MKFTTQVKHHMGQIMSQSLKTCKYHLLVLLAIFLSIPCGSCKGDNQSSTPLVGGPCTYTDTPGSATIMSMSNANPSLYNCKNNPVEVIFNFTPDDSSKANDATDKNQSLTVGAGANPPRDYAINKGLTVGSVHQCIRQNETSGACTPWGFTFPSIDFSDYGTYCF